MKKILKSLRRNKVFYTMIFLLFLPFVAFADSALQWDINDDADYYVVYWGNSSGDYSEGHSSRIDFDTPVFPIAEHKSTKTYYYAVKAFNKYGNSSDFSDEVAIEHTQDIDYVIDAGNSGSDSGGCFIYSAFR